MRQWQMCVAAPVLFLAALGLSVPRSAAVVPEGETAEFSTKVLSTGKIAVRVPAGRISVVPPRTGKGVPGPILSLRGPDGVWRGAGWIEGQTPVAAIDAGPEGGEYVVTYAFAGGGRSEMRFRLPPDADHVRVTEECAGCTSTWVLSFGEDFGADRVVAKPTEADGGSGVRRVRPGGQWRHGQIVLWSQFGRLLDFNDFMGVFGGTAPKDFVGFLRVHSEAWSRPPANRLSLWERDGTLRLEGTWQAGRREWLLVVTPRTGDDAADARERLCAIEREWVWHRKGWVLDWEDAPPQYRPEIAETQASEKGMVLSELDALTTLIVQQGVVAPPHMRRYLPVLRAYARLRALGALTPAEDRRARRALTALGYNGYRKDLFPWDRAGLPPDNPESLGPLVRGWISPTFNTERYVLLGELAMLFPEHPMARLWFEHFVSQFRLQMETCVCPGGFWKEGVAGACEALVFLTPTAIQMRRLGKFNAFADPRFRAMWEFLIQSATPRAIGQGGRRSIPAVGEVPDPRTVRDLLLLGALGFEPGDPMFAARLLWLHRELGGTADGDPGRLLDEFLGKRPVPSRPLVSLGLPSTLTTTSVELSSVNLPGFGAILRSEEGTCLVLRNGPALGRSHYDEGSIHLWAKGEELVVDAGEAGPGPWRQSARGHSRVAFAEFEPAYFLDGVLPGYERSPLGQAQAFVSLSGADYVAASAPIRGGTRRDPRAPFSHQPQIDEFEEPIDQRRHVVFVKPDHFVVVDELDTDKAHDFWLHVKADGVTTGPGWATFEHRRDIALDVLFLQPRRVELETGEVRTTAGLTRYVRAGGDPASGYRVVLFPRDRHQPRPSVREVAPGVVRLQQRGDWELVVLDRSTRRYRDRLRSVSVEASVAVVRHHARQWTAVLFAGESIELPGLEIRASAAVSVRRDRHRVVVVDVADHDKPVVVRLSGRWLWRRSLHLPDGQTQRIRGGTLNLSLPPGINSFRVE